MAVLSDLICPADERGPSATAVGVPDVIDEWVSAPCSGQQRDREQIVNGLQWLNDEAQLRFESDFVALTEERARQSPRMTSPIVPSMKSVSLNCPRFLNRLERLVFGILRSLKAFRTSSVSMFRLPATIRSCNEAMEHIGQVASDPGDCPHH